MPAQRAHVFTMTERESQILSLFRQTRNKLKIAELLGIHHKSVDRAIRLATEKERLLIATNNLRDFHDGVTTNLKRARGNSHATVINLRH